jgi:uncharacterized DUF497 family protein
MLFDDHSIRKVIPSKKEIEEFFQVSPVVMPDPHPDEPRMRAIGRTKAGRYVFLVFMFRLIDGQTFIRPISARYMHQREVVSIHSRHHPPTDSIPAD